MNKILSLSAKSFNQNLKPGIVLWLFALVLVLMYYFYQPSKALFDVFGELKIQFGSNYAIVSTAFFGGLIPFIYLYLSKQITKLVLPELLFYLVFWAWKGWEVDLFYTYQGYWFGDNPDFSTIITKMLVDQFVYSFLWAAPTIAILYLWKNCQFNIRLFRKELNSEFFRVKLPAVIISNWLVWIPAVSIIYSLPVKLQIPLFNLVLCFWVILLAVLNKRKV